MQLNVREVSPEDIENFVNYFYKDEQGEINLRSFMRIFERYEKQLDAEDNVMNVREKRKRPMISKKIIEKKKQVFE